jgi:hypothetical protein
MMPLKNTRIAVPFRVNLLAIGILLNGIASHAQYQNHPLTNKKWLSMAVGASTSDKGSSQLLVNYHHRSDNILTSLRFGYSQELGLNPNDTCTNRQNKTWEIGVLWGDGYAGRKVYFVAGAGMGLFLRRQCLDTPFEEQDFGSRVTIGVPAQVELGYFISKKIFAHLTLNGGWNFRQPYIGALAGISFALTSRSKSESND